MNRRQCLGLVGALGASSMLGTTAAGQRPSSDSSTENASTADHIITTLDELHHIFRGGDGGGGGLSPGDVVYITDENAPYRTQHWLDIDVDDVVVKADRTRPLVKPAANANAGGLRIGHSNPVRNVTISGFSFDGNYAEQRRGIQHHGVYVEDATDVAVKDCYVSHTHPYHEHGSGGSGITVGRKCQNVRIQNNTIEEIGDRGIQVAGRDIVISGNMTRGGFDRSIALAATEGSRGYGATNVTVTGNIGVGNSDGSFIGDHKPRPPSGVITITGNIAHGSHRSLVTLHTAGNDRLTIVGNAGFGGSADGIEVGRSKTSGVGPTIVANNILESYQQTGILVEGGSTDAVIQGNIVLDPGNRGIFVRDESKRASITGNSIRGASRNGIQLSGGSGPATISDNTIAECGWHGIRAGSFSGPISITGNSIEQCSLRKPGKFHGISIPNGTGVVSANVVGDGNHAAGIGEDNGTKGYAISGNFVDAGSVVEPIRVMSNRSTLSGNAPSTN